jgi:LPS sulfotransferase NodH
VNPEDIWRDFFPNSKNIFLTRLNKVEQVVSWWKAIQDNEWHIHKGKQRKTKEDFYQDKYDLDALKFLLSEIMLRETATIDLLHQNNLDFITLSYEDLIAKPEKIVNYSLDYLGLTNKPIKISDFKFQKTANRHSLKWIKKLRYDLQKDMDNIIW